MASFVTPPSWAPCVGHARGPTCRISQQAYRSLTGAEAPSPEHLHHDGPDLRGAIYTLPLVYIMIATRMELIASDLEEAAAILGPTACTWP